MSKRGEAVRQITRASYDTIRHDCTGRSGAGDGRLARGLLGQPLRQLSSPASGLIASDPILSTAAASSGALARSLLANDSTVYVALFPGTVLGGSLARV